MSGSGMKAERENIEREIEEKYAQRQELVEKENGVLSKELIAMRAREEQLRV